MDLNERLTASLAALSYQLADELVERHPLGEVVGEQRERERLIAAVRGQFPEPAAGEQQLDRLLLGRMEAALEGRCQLFFDRLYHGLMEQLSGKVVGERFDRLEREIVELRASIGRAHLNPLAWYEAEVVGLVVTALRATPPPHALPLDTVYQVVVGGGCTVPGSTRGERLVTVLQICRRSDLLRTDETGFIVSLANES